MEECDELCNRLGIMVNGQFQCFGSSPYLKQKFGQGFTILVKLNTQHLTPEESIGMVAAFKEYISEKFHGKCLVKDEHKVIFSFHFFRWFGIHKKAALFSYVIATNFVSRTTFTSM